MKIISIKKLILFVFVFFFFSGKISFAVWSGDFYNPGETFNPECLPAQANCDVLVPFSFQASLFNYFFGKNAGNTTMTGNRNTATGYGALNLNTTGISNTANGTFALENNTTGSNNTAYGTSALRNNVSGSNNTAMGLGTLFLNTADNNTALGFASMNVNTTGANNTANGFYSLFGNTTGNGNTGFGFTALQDNTTGYYNTAIGNAALYDLDITADDGSGNNTAIGYNTGRGIITGINNTILGANVTGLPAALSNTVIIADGQGNRFAHNFALTGTAGRNTFVGLNAGNFTMTGSTGSQGSYNTAMGYEASFSNTTGFYNANFGYQAGYSNTTGRVNTNIGYQAGFSLTNSQANTNVGTKAGYSNVSGFDNSNFGYYAGLNNIGNDNSNFGTSAGQSNTTGSDNSNFGRQAGLLNITGSGNVALGSSSLYSNTTGSQNIAVGVSSLYDLGSPQTAGNFVTGVSYTILTVGTTDFTLIGAVDNNIGTVFTATGAGSGDGTATANDINNNTALGYNTGRGIVTGINNTILGANVTGLPATLSNTVIIADGEGNRFSHNFALSETTGYNTFVGINAGNFTMTGSTGDQGSYNTGIGYNVLLSNTTGSANTANGYKALNSNTDGVRNTANGMNALRLNTTGANNTASGYTALLYNVAGSDNTATGSGTLVYSKGNSNTANGAYALGFITTGDFNTALGANALSDVGAVQTAGDFVIGVSYTIVTTGSTDFTLIGAVDSNVGTVFIATGVGSGDGTATSNNTSNNTALGYNSGRGIITGVNNTILGANVTGLPVNLSNTVIIADGSGNRFAHNFALTGTDGHNTFVGMNSGNFTMTGSTGVQGSYNTGIGYDVLLSNTTGNTNTGVGFEALKSNTTGNYNTALGIQALSSNTTGSNNIGVGYATLYDLDIIADNGSGNNTAVGHNTGRGIITGLNNTIIGANVVGLPDTLSNNIIIADGEGNQRINVDNNGLIGIGSTAPSSKMQIGLKVADDSGFAYDADSLMVVHQTPTATATLNDPKNVLMLARQGTDAEAHGAAAAFNLSRFEDNGTDSRTRLDISLAHTNFDPLSNNIMTLLSNGNVGIGTTAPGGLLHLKEVDGVIGSSLIIESINNSTSEIILRPTGLASSIINASQRGANGTDLAFYTKTDGDIVGMRMVISDSGNVGIGTGSPQKTLEINDNDANTTTSGLRFTNFACAGTDKLTVGAGGDVICGTDQVGGGAGNVIDTLADTLGAANDANALDINNIGKLYTALGSEALPSFSFQADTDTGIWSSAGNILNFSTGAAERMRISDAGYVGIGTTDPGFPLEVNNSIKVGTTSQYITMYGTDGGAQERPAGVEITSSQHNFNLSTGAAVGNSIGIYYLDGSGNGQRSAIEIENPVAGFSNLILMKSGGNVGIGNTAPGYMLHVGSTSVTDATVLLRLEDADSVCDFTANAGAPACGSDETLKKNINNQKENLAKVLALRPVTYNWLTDQDDSEAKHGFIAQEVAIIMPELVTDGTWIDGTTRKFLQTTGMTPYIIGAIQELNSNLESLTLPITQENITQTFTERFFGKLTAWLADTTNGIGSIFAETYTAKEKLCINNTCVTEEQLQTLLQNANISPAPVIIPEPAPAPTATPDPVNPTEGEEPTPTSDLTPTPASPAEGGDPTPTQADPVISPDATPPLEPAPTPDSTPSTDSGQESSPQAEPSPEVTPVPETPAQ